MSDFADGFDRRVAEILDSLNETNSRLALIPIMCAGLTLLGQLVVAVAHVADAVNACDLSLARIQNRIDVR